MQTTFQALQATLQGSEKTWLVTGVAGFIGSNLAEFLLANHQKVVGLDNFATGYQTNIDQIIAAVTPQQAANFNFINGDITDLATCQRVCQQVDIVLHQAALGSVPRSIADPIATNHVNITGFLNLLTAAKEANIKRFVYASSSSVYGDSVELPKVEARTGNLLSPYAVTKYTNELYAQVFYKTYGIETIGLRYFNVFGRRQDPNGAYAAVIPKWVGALLNTEAVYINGDGENSRDFCYIDNVVQMNILAALTDNTIAYGDVFNVAVGGQTTLNQLHQLINDELAKKLSGFIKTPAIYREFRLGDITHSNANITKAQHRLGYAPTHTIEQGMSLALDWYINNK